MRKIAGRHVVLRRARGFAPFPFACPAVREPVLALGGQQKNTVATAFAGRIFLSPHIGDLSSPAARQACEEMAGALTSLHRLAPAKIACDSHPDYYTSRLAGRFGLPVTRVPHHLAHVLAGMVDNELEGPVLGVAWDGTGHGGDGTVWGGEFLAVEKRRFRRFAHLRCFALPGGEAAVREPRRAALGVLYALFGEEAFERRDLAAVAAFTSLERSVLSAMLRRTFQAPFTSSAGRLFDAAAAILDLCQRASYEGEAAMAVEFAADRAQDTAQLPAPVLTRDQGRWTLDWRPLFEALVGEVARGAPCEPLAAGLHEGFAEAIVGVAERAGIRQIVLTGGCFQNARLTTRAATRLRAAGFSPFWHRRIPPNDGGLAVGQAVFAARPLTEERC
jgi:hydrogenase maturation protein HypF